MIDRHARVQITDPADPRLDDFRDLTTADRRPDRPGGRGLVIAEGVVVVRRLLASRYPLRAVLGVARRYDQLSPDVNGLAAPCYVATPEVMAAVVGFHLNRGVLATADRIAVPPVDVLVDEARTVVVLEGVGDHENLGALFRNAAAFEVGAVLLAAGCADPLYRRSVRVSMGTVLSVPFSPNVGLIESINALRDRGFQILALTPSGDLSLREMVWPKKVAILVGAEGPGLTAEALQAADVRLRIPMSNGVDSLNVATAAAIAFAQCTR